MGNPDASGSEALNMIQRSQLARAVLLLSAFLLDRRLHGADWARFLGPLGTGVSTETGLAKSWPKDGPPIVWKRRVGASFTAPAIAGGELILFHRLGGYELVECLDPRTAKRKWWFHYPTSYSDTYGYNDGPRSSPVISQNRVYTFGAEGELYCLDRGTGKPIWHRSVNKEYKVDQNHFGVGTTPLLEGGLLLINVGGPNGAGIVAFDAKTGKTVWRTTDDRPSYTSPVCKTIRGKRYAFFLTRRGLVVTDPTNGNVHAARRFRSPKTESVNAATPLIVDDMIFLSAAYGTGAALLRLTDKGLELVWRTMEMSNHWATSIHLDGYLYGTHGRHTHDSSLRCIELKSGKLIWQKDGLGVSSQIYADGLFYILGDHGDLVLAALTPEGYFEKGRMADLLRPPCFVAPVLANGLLYVRDETQVLCLDVRERGHDD